MMSLSEAAAAIGGRVHGADARFDSVSSDSRTIARGALFVALRGEKFDGHAYLNAAHESEAIAALVDERSVSGDPHAILPCVVVEDTRLALGRLAAHWRRRFNIPVIVVVGSNGKTTVKEMIAAILRAQHGEARVLVTEGNLNNDIGLPMTLLRLRGEHRVAVIELGMNHAGETAYLAPIAAPTVALINNAQREHQEFMKSVADVAREHGATIAALPDDGIAVINADDEFAGYWRGLAAGKRVRDFGIEHPAQVSGRHRFTSFGSEIELRAPEGEAKIELHVDGRHNALNAMAAAAAATAAGATLEAVSRGLAAFHAVRGRLQKKAALSGAVVIDDTYNANPDSVRAAIDVLAAVSGKRLLALGDMGEVGEHGEAFHKEIGRYAKQRGIDRLLATGELCRHAVAAFGAGANHFAAIGELIDSARCELGQNGTALVKGSRFMRMERVVDALCGAQTQTGGH